MTYTARAVLILVLVTVAPGCGRETEPSGDVQIAFRTNPDPPVTGENAFEVDVTQPDGSPVTDATVTAEFFMPAMPSMKMPEMRNLTTLSHEGGGIYSGKGQVMMAGSWDVTVTVTRGGQTLGARKMSVTAK